MRGKKTPAKFPFHFDRRTKNDKGICNSSMGRDSGVSLMQTPCGCVPTEHQEQAAFFAQAAYLLTREQYELLYAIPNGAHKSLTARMKFQREGLKAGVPDVSFDYPASGYHGLRIEFKRRKKSKISEEQKRKIDLLNKHGYKAVVCYGCDEAIQVLTEYLKGECKHNA